MVASVTDWVSAVALTLVGIAAASNVSRGTFGEWVRAKTLLSAPPPKADVIPFSGFAGGGGFGSGGGGGSPWDGPDPRPPIDLPGATYGDPAPTARMISVFGDCRSGISCSDPCCRRHEGIDLAAPTGTHVFAITSGRVTRSGTGSGGCGLRVAVSHADGSEAIYCHLDALGITAGETVALGTPVGSIGTTGNARGTTPHLHFEIHVNGQAVDPAPLIGR